jgi:chromosome segregation ATPase
MSEDKEKRILELEDEVFSLSSAAEQKDAQLSQLQTELSAASSRLEEAKS